MRERSQESGVRSQESGFRIQDSGFRIQDSGFGSQAQSLRPRLMCGIDSWRAFLLNRGMKKISRVLLLMSAASLVAGSVGFSQDAAKPAPKKKVNPSLVKVEDVAGLPRVLLIGDSISMGYTVPVRKLLKGKANVHRIPTNGGPTSRGIANIDQWLGDGKWDVIHFNWGIHDLKFMPTGLRQVEPADYEKNLRALVAKLKATGATLIWAETTPIPDEMLVGERKFGDEAEYNRIAAKIMKEEGVVTNDLNAFVTPRFAELQKPKDLHYKSEGSDYLATKVAKEIEAVLK